MIDFHLLFLFVPLLMTVEMLTQSGDPALQANRRCFPASNVCLAYLTDLVRPPQTTGDADTLCRSTGGKLLELGDDESLSNFRDFARELELSGVQRMSSKFFINLRRIASRNRWMWLQPGTNIPSLQTANTLPTGLSAQTGSSNSCAFVKKVGPFALEFGAAPCNEIKGYLCKTLGCLQPSCYQYFYRKDWTSASATCNLVSVLDSVSVSSVPLQNQDPIQVLVDFETKILNSLTFLPVGEELWIGLTKYYWTWTSTGAMVDPDLLPWNWEANDGTGPDDCLIRFPSLTIDTPTGGIAWGVVCMGDYNSSQPATTNLVLVNESPTSSPTSSSSSSSSSTSATTMTSSSSSSSSSSLPSSSITSSPSSSSSSTSTSLLPSPATTPTSQPQTTRQGNLSSDGNVLIIALVLGISLGVLITLLVAVLIFRIARKKAKLKEREANEEFHYSTEIPQYNIKEIQEDNFLDSTPDILGDDTTSFSTKILKSITSGDENPVRPVTPTAISLDAPTMFRNYENFPDFNTSFT